MQQRPMRGSIVITAAFLMGFAAASGFVLGLHATEYTFITVQPNQVIAYTEFIDGAAATYYTYTPWLFLGLCALGSLFALESAYFTLYVLDHNAKGQPPRKGGIKVSGHRVGDSKILELPGRKLTPTEVLRRRVS